jgi:hypothetical protein
VAGMLNYGSDTLSLLGYTFREQSTYGEMPPRVLHRHHRGTISHGDPMEEEAMPQSRDRQQDDSRIQRFRDKQI